jgi:hypothetical protein
MNEYQLQQSIVAECDLRANQDKHYGLILAIPNGQFRRGQRMEPGLRAGAPDLLLPVPRRGYHGLFMELKVGRNRLTAQQSAWLSNLKFLGYCAVVVYDDPAEAMRVLQWYLEDSGKNVPGDCHQ